MKLYKILYVVSNNTDIKEIIHFGVFQSSKFKCLVHMRIYTTSNQQIITSQYKYRSDGTYLCSKF